MTDGADSQTVTGVKPRSAADAFYMVRGTDFAVEVDGRVIEGQEAWRDFLSSATPDDVAWVLEEFRQAWDEGDVAEVPQTHWHPWPAHQAKREDHV